MGPTRHEPVRSQSTTFDYAFDQVQRNNVGMLTMQKDLGHWMA